MSAASASDPTLRRIFENEAAETLDAVQEHLLLLERHGDPDGARLEDLLRMAHNLKGSSRVAGLEHAGAFMHEIEARLQSWRGSPVVGGDEIDLVLRAFDVFGALALAPDDAGRLDEARAVGARLAEAAPAPGAPAVPRPAATAPSAPAPAAGRASSPDGADHAALRVPRPRIDAVVDGAGEVLAETFAAQAGFKALERAMRRLVEVALPHDAHGDLVGARRQLRDAVRELRPVMHRIDQHGRRLVERSRALCLVPVSGLLVHLKRVARDAARELRRELVVEEHGGDLSMDVALVEALKGPLAHVLRNAVDHGIEPPDERVTSGKPRAGKVTLALRQKGDRIVISVRDDGRGIDLEAVRRRLGAAGADVPREDLCRAVLAPGFTTRDQPTEISGRGIGLGAVAATAERLRGRVAIDTDPGRGTEVVLDLPVDLSIVRGVTVDVAGMRLVLPRARLAGVGDQGDGARAVDLAGLLGVARQDAGDAAEVVVLSGRAGPVPVSVDRIVGPVEVVRRPLGGHLGRVRYVEGAAILEHGEPALILDAGALADAVAGEVAQPPKGATRARVLIVDDSPTLRARLRHEIGQAGFDVETAEDGEAACALLAVRRCDAVVTDVRMPRLDGHGLLDRLGGSLPVILVTSYPTPEGEAWARRRGAAAYLPKGDDIGRAVARALLDLLPASTSSTPECPP